MALTYRDIKGSPLTSAEADANIRTLDAADKSNGQAITQAAQGAAQAKTAADAARSVADAAQPGNENLTALASLVGIVNQLAYFTGKGQMALAALSQFARENILTLDSSSALSTLINAGAANGLATLDAGGKIPVSQLPPLAVNETFTVANQAAMLALTAQRGDIAIRSDQSGKPYVLAADAPATLANWIPLDQSLAIALAALSAITPAANKVPMYDSAATAKLIDVSPAAQTVLDDLTVEAMLATMKGLPIAGGKLTGGLDWANFVPLASADGLDIGGAASNLIQITGTTAITGFKAANPGSVKRVLFTGVLTLTHSAKLVLPGGVNISTAVGDWADFVCWDGTNWYCSQYQRNLNTPALLTQSTTDSTVGRILKVGDFGLGHIVSPIPPTGTNLNLLGVQGTYRLDSTYTGSPFGAARQGDVIEILAWNGGVVHQNFYAIEGDVWYRKIDVSSGTQTTWRKMYGQLNIVGTVGQSNGLPNGAIVERGTNANGEYTRYADGTLECWLTNRQITYVDGLTLRSTWNFPSLFSSSTSIDVQVTATGSISSAARIGLLYHDTPAISGVNLYVLTNSISPFTNADFASVSAKAIGRWF